MSSGPPDLPEELVSLDDLQIVLESGRSVSVRRYRAHLHECREKPTIGLDRGYSSKPLVLVEKQVAFPEIAVLFLLKKMGWEGAWVDTPHRKYFDRMPNQSKGISLDAHASQAFTRIASYNQNSRAGCWDLVLWNERALAFAAVVGGGAGGTVEAPAALGEARTRWLAAAVKSGMTPGQFVVVEWEYRRVIARRKRSG
jgi:hypothetical protein